MKAETDSELKALVTLGDGRKAWRDGRGRFREATSGRFIKMTGNDSDNLRTEKKGTAGSKTKQHVGAKAQAKAHLLQAVRALGLTAENAEDAWGRLVGVQARIALDQESGARATAAAKLVAQATGLIDEGEGGKPGEGVQIEMNEDDARELLRLIREEKKRRKQG